MYRILVTFGTALAAVLSDRVITYLQGMLEGSENLSLNAQAALDTVVSSQAVAAVVKTRFGIPGLATAYDFGIISEADFAAYVVMAASYRIAPASESRILSLEEEAGEQSLLSFMPSGKTLADLTTMPENVAKMYAYLLAQRDYAR